MTSHALSHPGTTLLSIAQSRHTLHIPSIVLLLIFHALGTAQTRELRFELIPLEGGVTDYRAHDVAQDSIGFLWFATANGLYRYDGLQTTVYRPRLNDTTSIGSLTIWALMTDRRGRLWIGTFDAGLDCYDPATDTFQHWFNLPSDSLSLGHGAITALLEDRAGGLWVGTEHSGLIYMDVSRQHAVHFRHEPGNRASLSDNTIRALCEDQNGRLWIGTAKGLNLLEPGGSSFRVLLDTPGQRSSMSENVISSLWCDQSNAIWVGTRSKGLNRVEWPSGRITRFDHTSLVDGARFCDSITAIFQNHPDFLWVGTFRGVFRVDPAARRFEHFTHDPFIEASLSSARVRAIRGDRGGTLWIATDYYGTEPQLRGVNKLIRACDQFEYFRIERRGGGALPVTALAHHDGSNTTWIGTEGLRSFQRETGKSAEYRHDPSNPASLSDDLIESLYVDLEGALWVGTWTGGLNRFEPRTSSFTRFPISTAHNDAGSALTICENSWPGVSPRGKDIGLWVGTYDEGLVSFSPILGVTHRYRNDPANPRSLGSNRVLATIVDSHGTLWVGTDGGGLNRMERGTSNFVRYVHDARSPSTLRSSRVLALLEDPTPGPTGDVRLWVGTATGLDKFDAGTGTAAHMTLRDSAEAIQVLGIVLAEGNLWISTADEGLFMLSQRDGTVRSFSDRNGLPYRSFSRAYAASANGEIILGQYEGFIRFHPDSIRFNPYPPPVVLTAFHVFDAPHPTDRPLWALPSIHLGYDEDFFSFQFAALDYTDPERNAFSYKLDGFDQAWNQPGSRNFAGYTKVDPGEYTFRVRGSNSDGIWNESGIALHLQIDPPYWQTWWFRGLIGTIVLAMVAGAYRYRVAKLLEMERMRLRIASDLHDDIGSSLSGIALVAETLTSRQGLEDRDRQHLSDVTRTARRTADALRDIVWLVNPEHDSLDDLYLRLKDAATMVLTGTEHTIATSGASLSTTMSLEFRHNLILIYKEILNNIAKHARAKHVSIEIRHEGDELTLQIADDGIGFDPAVATHGNGLRNLQQRAGQMGGIMHLESAPGRGTTVRLTARVR